MPSIIKHLPSHAFQSLSTTAACGLCPAGNLRLLHWERGRVPSFTLKFLFCLWALQFSSGRTDSEWLLRCHSAFLLFFFFSYISKDSIFQCYRKETGSFFLVCPRSLFLLLFHDLYSRLTKALETSPYWDEQILHILFLSFILYRVFKTFGLKVFLLRLC